MSTLSRIIADVRNKLGSPTQDVMPDRVIFDELVQTEGFYNAQLELSNQNQLVTKYTFQPTDRDVSLPGYGFTSPAFVEWQSASDTDDSGWSDLVMVNLDSVSENENSGIRVCSFYNTPTRIKFSWNPNDLQDRIRIWYDPQTSDHTALTDSPQWPGYYHAMLGDCVALKCLPLLLRADPTSSEFVKLQMGLLGKSTADWSKQWDLWRLSSRQQKPTQSGAYTGSRQSSRSGPWGW